MRILINYFFYPNIFEGIFQILRCSIKNRFGENMDFEIKRQKSRFELLPLILLIAAFPQFVLSVVLIYGSFVHPVRRINSTETEMMIDFLLLCTFIVFAIAYIGAFIDMFFRMIWPFLSIAATLFCWILFALWITIDLYRNPVMNSDGPEMYADYSYAWIASLGTFYLYALFALNVRLAWIRREIWYNQLKLVGSQKR